MTHSTAPRQPLDIRQLAAAAKKFGRGLERIKGASRSQEFEWYPYDTLAVFDVLEPVLRVERRDLPRLAGTAPVLDIGAGDGDLSFFFESLGCDVVAIDNPATNYNGTLGFQALRSALGTRAELELRDLDAGLNLSGRTFGLAFCLGLLYHLKNPYGFLEALARHARYCVLSTRVAQVTAKGTEIEQDPVACLVSPSETNADATNFWVFSDAGLRRILDRTGWDVCDFTTTGCRHRSDPTRHDRDQRAFSILRSKLPDPWLDTDLDGGWHVMEAGCWRWTERVFNVRLLPPETSAPALRFQFRNPLGPLRLRATVGGLDLPWSEYGPAGEHTYAHPVPPAAITRTFVPVRFEVEHREAPAMADQRELGVQVLFWAYDEPVPRALVPISLI